MKKQILHFGLLNVLLSLTLITSAQNAYYDALKIDFLNTGRELFKKNSNSKDSVIRRHANSDLKKINGNLDTLNYDSFISSPFLLKLNQYNLNKIRSIVAINDHGQIGWDKSLQLIGTQGVTPTELFSIPVSAQSIIIDGTAKFIAERFKEDITSIYIDKLRKRLDNIPELKAFYPKTYSFLKSADVFNYRSLGNDFKEAFEEDLKNILGNLQVYINKNEELKTKLINSKVYYPFDFILALSDKLVKEYHPVEILDFLEQNYKENAEFKDYYNVVHGLNIIQNNLQRQEKNNLNLELIPQFKNIWVKFSDLNKINTDQKIEFFLAIIYWDDPEYFKSVLKIDTVKVKDFFRDIIYPITGLLNNIENLQSKEKMTGDDYVEVISNTVELLKLINAKSKPSFDKITFVNLEGKVDTLYVLELMDKMVDLYKSIYTRDYGNVVTNSLYIVEKILSACRIPNSVIVNVTQAMSQYGGFMVDVVTAKNSDDVKEAIKNNVTKFSYLDKRNSLINFTLGAHPGVFAGWEKLVTNNSWELNTGITAPIGFELMCGIRRSEKSTTKNLYAFAKDKSSVKYLSGYAWSLFASFVDLGAVFNYRLNDSKNELPQQLTFKQIFSPGIFVNFAFRNTPLTLGAGIQYIPELRRVTVDNIETSSNSLRGMLRLSWDIPLVKIGSKKVK